MARNNMNIGEVADLDSIRQNLRDMNAVVKDEVSRLVAEVNKEFQGIKITLPELKNSKTFAEQVENAKKLQAAMEGFTKATKEDIQFQKELDKLAKENTKNLLANERQKQAEMKATAKAQKEIRKDMEGFIKSVKDGQKEMAKLFAEREKMARNEEKAAKKQADKEAAAIARENIRIAKEHSAALRQLKKDTDELAKANLKEAKELERSRSAYTRLSDAHIVLKQKAKDLGAELGVESAQFIKARDEANKLGDRLKAIDGNLGVHGRNVGNYASQWNGLSYSMTNIISELPNAAQSPEIFFRSISNNFTPIAQNIQQINRENKVLIAQGQPVVSVWKQIGAAIFSFQTALIVGVTLLTAYGDDIVNFFTKAGDGAIKASDGTKIYTKELKVLSQVYKEAATTYAKTAAELDILKTRFFDTTATAKTKQEVIKTLNKNYEDSIGKIKGINEAEDFFINRSAAFVESLRLRAEMEAAYNVLAENKQTLLKQEATTVEDNVSKWQKFAAFNKTFFSGEGMKAIGKNLANAFSNKPIEKSFDALYKNRLNWQAIINTSEVDNAVQHSNSVVEKFILKQGKELEAFDAKYGFGSGKKEPKEKKAKAPTDTTNAEISAAERINKAKAEMNKVALEEEKTTAQAIYQNEQATLEERLAAHSDYLNATLALSKINQQTELKNIQENLDKIAEIEGKKGKRTQQEKKLLTEKEAFETEKTAITAKYAIEANKILSDSQKEAIGLIKNSVDEETRYRIEALEKISTNISEQEQAEVNTLVTNLSKKKISVSQYEQQYSIIRSKYAKKGFDESVSYLQELLTDETLTADDRAKVIKKLEEVKVQQAKLANEEIYDSSKKLADAQKQLQQEVVSFVSDLFKINIDKRLAEIDKLIEKNDELKQHTLDSINTVYDSEQRVISQTITDKEKRDQAIKESEQRRIAATMMAERNAEIQKQALEKQKRDELQKQARFDKAASIAGIIAKTAEAVVGALKVPLIGLKLASTYAFIGAAQLTKVLTTTIPAYKEGTRNHPGGPAIVGDGGEEELIVEDGKAWISPAKSTYLSNLSIGAQVIPKSKIETMASLGGILNNQLIKMLVPNMRSGDNGAMLNEIKSLRKDIKNSKKVSITYKDGALYLAEKVGNQTTNFLKKS